MGNSARYVKTYINNSGLIPQAVPSDFPLLVSTNGYQHLSQLVPAYIFEDDLYNYYEAENWPVSTLLEGMFEQTQSPSQVWGFDLETTYTMTLVADGSLTVEVQWLDIDNSAYTVLNTTVANLAALATYLTAQISTCDFTVDTLELTVDPKVASPNQLVRINITNLDLTAYSFTASGAPAGVAAAFNALVAEYPNSQNFYALVIEGSIFYPALADSSSTKITAQLALANAVEATTNSDDNRKVMLIASADTDILDGSSTTDIMYEVKDAALERTAVAYYAGASLAADAVSARFGLNDGNNSWAFTTLIGLDYEYLSDSQLNVIYLLDDNGNLDPSCKNGNYYDNSASRSFFYPGVTGSGLPLDITILSDHIARDCRYAQIQFLNDQANGGNDVPYNQQGINQMVSVIRGVMNGYLQNGFISPVDNKGNSCVINAPTFAQIQAATPGSALANQFINRVLTGITINYVPAGGINKVGETFTAII